MQKSAQYFPRAFYKTIHQAVFFRFLNSKFGLSLLSLLLILAMFLSVFFVSLKAYPVKGAGETSGATALYTINDSADIVNERGGKIIFPGKQTYSNDIGAGGGEIAYLGLRFTQGTLPPYVTIVGASIVLTTSDINSVSVQVSVAAEKNLSAPSFSGISLPSTRYTNHTATVTDYNTTPPKKKDAPFAIDVTAQVQELMNLPGRLPGMPLSFIFKAPGSGGHRHFYNTQTPAKAPRLTVTYYTGALQMPPSVTVTSSPSSTSSLLDTMVRQTLDDIDRYGWNHAVGGIYINWYLNDPTRHQNPGHDGQNDLRDYETMVWYEALHPGDTSQQAAIARLLPTIKIEWGHSSLPKGWIYFLFQRLAHYSGDVAYWTSAMEHWAATVYKGIDPVVGVAHGPIIDSTAANAPTCPDGYRVDQNLENGLALIDAGKRFGQQAWVQAGTREVNVITQQAFVRKYHLYARIVCQGKIWNWEAKAGEYGQEIDALLKVGVYAQNQTYLSLAEQMLDEIANPQTGLRDMANGGIYFKLLLNTGNVDTSRKEMRQFAVLQALHEANAIFGNRYAAFESDMIKSVEQAFFTSPVAGWMDELNPNWTLYKGKEDWISMEASGMAMEAILTVMRS
jgi:hypothetical protein